MRVREHGRSRPELRRRDLDAVVCIQNGICAFGVDQESLLREALRCTRAGGILLFSTYSDRFWKHRLEWFQAQAAAGLVGPIDVAASGGGTLVCKDGFRATRLTAEEWRVLCAQAAVDCRITDVDRSSVFCEIVKRADPQPRRIAPQASPPGG